MLNTEYLQLRKKIMDDFFKSLNPQQRRAVYAINGPVLILAGAGSGKTTVLIHRIACMLQFGDAYDSPYVPADLSREDLAFLQEYADGDNWEMEKAFQLLAHNPVMPWNILAITFTNKAAGELRERLQNLLGEAGKQVNAFTFHSACCRILRSEIEHLGFTRNFTIYDTDDSLRVLREVLRDLNIGEKAVTPRSLLSSMGRAKDALLSPSEYAQQIDVQKDYFLKLVSQVYPVYQERLRRANALDFDDILYYTVRLFQQYPEVLEHYRQRYKYVLVDEYQDTNHVQFELVRLLTEKSSHICVVGDDDQSIYKFRGATIENILSFEKTFAGAQVIRLEQNYRSTKTILDAANHLIDNNTARKGKTLWTDNQLGTPIQVAHLYDEYDEARYITEHILDNIAGGGHYRDNVILYRLNAQSQALERGCVSAGIPYRIIGGQRFFDRKEIKDMLAYLTVLQNPTDTLRFARIVNEPKRGIGDVTLERLQEIAYAENRSALEVMAEADNYPTISNKAKVLVPLAAQFRDWMNSIDKIGLDKLLKKIRKESGYEAMLKADKEHGATRLEQIMELESTLKRFMESNENPTLAGYLEEISLYTDLDRYNQQEDAVILMTMHSAKGLEFDNVFVAGMEEDVFPSYKSALEAELLEEERRLAYVCITRAKKSLTLCVTSQRMLYAHTMWGKPSRFINEIPTELCIHTGKSTRSRSMNTRESMQNPMNRDSSTNVVHYSAATGTIRNPADKERGGGFSAAQQAPSKASAQAFAIGMRVHHKTFGDGTIKNTLPLSGDTMLEIDFDTKGFKKIMATYAKLTVLP